MSEPRQAFKAAHNRNESLADEGKQLLTLGVAAAVLVGLGLVVLIVDENNLVSKAVTYIQMNGAPGNVTHLPNQGERRDAR